MRLPIIVFFNRFIWSERRPPSLTLVGRGGFSISVPKPSRRWLQISLFTLFWATLFLGMWVGLAGVNLRKSGQVQVPKTRGQIVVRGLKPDVDIVIASLIVDRLRALEDQGTLRDFDLSAQIGDGTVQVAGHAASPKQRDLVLAEISRFKGVRRVINEIQLISPHKIPTRGKKNGSRRIEKSIAAADPMQSEFSSTSHSPKADESASKPNARPIPWEIDMGMLFDAFNHPSGVDHDQYYQFPQGPLQFNPDAQNESTDNQLLPWKTEQPFDWEQLNRHPRR